MQRTPLHLALPLWLALGTACVSAGGPWGSSGKNNYDRHLVKHRRARVNPAKLRVLDVHVFAGHKLLSQRIGWRRRMRELLREVNKVVEPSLHLRLRLATTTRWQRKAGDDDLVAMLDELRPLLTAGPRDLVVGLVTPLALMEQSIHKLGLAEIAGSYMIMRAGRVTGELSAMGAERAVFIHELGHLLGADHTKDRADFMFPALSERMVRLSLQARRAMWANIHRRITTKAVATAAEPSPTMSTVVSTKPAAQTTSRATRSGYTPRFPGKSAQEVDDAFAAEIASADKQPGAVALIELRALHADITKRDVAENEEQDRLWILLARAYVKRYALTWARQALAKVRTPGISAATALSKRIAALRRRHRPPKSLAPEAEPAFFRKRVR